LMRNKIDWLIAQKETFYFVKRQKSGQEQDNSSDPIFNSGRMAVAVHRFSNCHCWILVSGFNLSRHGDATEDMPEL
jgi:hypothetical protein